MTNLPGDNPITPSMNDSDSEFVRQASMPLFSARGWLKFVGIMMILGGIPSALALVGIIPIWQGVLLLQAASSIETAANTGQQYAFDSAMGNIKTFFVINGVLIIIGIFIAVIDTCIYLVAGAAIFSSIGNWNY